MSDQSGRVQSGCAKCGHLTCTGCSCECQGQRGEGRVPSSGDDADQRVGWQFWRWPQEIRRLRRSQLHLLRRVNNMHVRAGIAEGWLIDGGDTALIDMTRGTDV